jgi:DNA modification methylase
MINKLYYGDNLNVLRRDIKDESIDLIYLDPPFNSKQGYNFFFKTPKGHISDAQVTAFEDTWHWGEQAEDEFAEILKQPNTEAAEMLQSLRRFLKETDIMAYLTMMSTRLLELHRSLKQTGTIYLHCDPTASHYLKLVMDSIFGSENFQNEIIWKRTSTKGDFKQGAKNWPRIHDVLIHYAKNIQKQKYFNQIFSDYNEDYIKKKYPYTDDKGKRYGLWDLTAPGSGSRGHPQYEFMGVIRYWRYNKEKMDRLLTEGRVIQPRPGAVPRYKRYLEEMQGVALGDVWDDIPPINSQAAERLGYPTQKPLALMERILEASSEEDDIILDPFCGCGTTIHAAQKMNRNWIGIDITSLSISVVEKRLRDAFPNAVFEINGIPKDLEGAEFLAKRDKYEFQWWVCALIHAQPYRKKKKGADTGIDGLIYFQDELNNVKKIIVSVKGGGSVSVSELRDLVGVVEREKAQIGLFIALAPPTKPMLKEAVSAGFYESPSGGKFRKIQILSVEGLLSGQEKPEYPDFTRGKLNYKETKKEIEEINQQILDL